MNKVKIYNKLDQSDLKEAILVKDLEEVIEKARCKSNLIDLTVLKHTLGLEDKYGN